MGVTVGKRSAKEADFQHVVQSQEQRKLKTRNGHDRTIWTGFSAFGAVGWSIAIPTLLGTLIGRWLDRRAPSDFSWTLALLLAGLSLGCMLAWSWVQKERDQIDNDT